MTLQRQYMLPNCCLTVEGLSGGDDANPMAPLTVVLNAECKFPGLTETLTGGRDFLEELVQTVSLYVQSLLSGITPPARSDAESKKEVILLKEEANQRHQILASVMGPAGELERTTLTLTTVQLFDLMEAVDQLLADTQTLPDMTLQLLPLHRRYARSTEPAAKRILPAAAGLSALAASAALVFALPVPEVEPETAREEQISIETASESSNGTSAGPDTDFSGEEALNTDRLSSEAATADAAAISPQIDSTTAITNPDEVTRLETQLEERLSAELADPPAFEEALQYRVTVSSMGDIVQFDAENNAAADNVDLTPIPDLVYTPVDREGAVEESVAQFLVTFDPSGEVTAESIDIVGE